MSTVFKTKVGSQFLQINNKSSLKRRRTFSGGKIGNRDLGVGGGLRSNKG
jgi:hypothetical protein